MAGHEEGWKEGKKKDRTHQVGPRSEVRRDPRSDPLKDWDSGISLDNGVAQVTSSP
jgi:hypothetical protein